MLLGLSNTLQCSEREAVRIALYEASARGSDAYETAFVNAFQNQEKRGVRGDSRRSNGSCQSLSRWLP